MAVEQELRDLVAAVRLGTPSGLEAACSAAERYLLERDEERVIFADLIEEARRQTDYELEIDDEPMLSVADEGVWVSAWIWVERTDEESK